MAEQQDLVIEILRRLQTDIAEIKHDVQSLRLEVSTINHHLAGFHSADAVQNDELSRLRQRVQLIERRLDLTGGDL